ncbi:FtsX-like permease family protein [Lapidilactobacillus achengensis]|uniref:FtsX-like permease family protein n=1 Tax=Lapidilactobacillus achengensis TaxID=2486000 RepID=A0ABW1UTT1_9LACO|nr:FtsX-like permease family protein [Lapidilactobacillus achengensis]
MSGLKRVLWKDILRSFTHSKGRFFSIMGLMMLGAFALVGLKVTGPDMRAAGTDYFSRYQSADLTVIGSAGLDQADVAALNQTKGASKIEYGYLKDLVVKGTQQSYRVFSKSAALSQYELVKGRLPDRENEIAVAAKVSGSYPLGSTITFTEKADLSGQPALSRHRFKVVGWVNSSEILSGVNMGQTTAGTGELNSYAVVLPAVFQTDYYMLARLSFRDTAGLDPYGDEYAAKIQAHKQVLNRALRQQPAARAATIKATYQRQITAAQAKIAQAKQKLTTAQQQLTKTGQQLTAGQAQLDQTKAQLAAARVKLDLARQQLATAQQQLSPASAALKSGQAKLQKGQAELTAKSAQLTQQRQTYQHKLQQWQTSQQQVATQKQQLTAAKQGYALRQTQLAQQAQELSQQLAAPGLSAAAQAKLQAQLQQVETARQQVAQQEQAFMTTTYQPGMTKLAAAGQSLTQQRHALQQAEQQLQAAANKLAQGRAAWQTQTGQWRTQHRLYQQKQADYQTGRRAYQQELQTWQQGQAAWQAGQTTLTTQQRANEQAQAKLTTGQKTAQQQISTTERRIKQARRDLANLATPTYTVASRREIPGGEGYKIYGSVAKIVDALANIFPIFLYFVAALVTFTTMTRFVDEERTNSGTLKALGYGNREIIRKFTVYGLVASVLGSAVGIFLGHTLLPLIVNNAYHKGFTLPRIKLVFHLGVTVVAVLLALISAVLPAWLVASRELREKPAALLLPAAPTAGSKIFLERLKPLWRRLSFTHKVTARNLFRYKKRMLMTIFGVSGAVTMLFAGFSVQHSISGISQRQFGELIHYDLIVARNATNTSQQNQAVTKLLQQPAVTKTAAIHYEEMTKVAGADQDTQAIKLIVPQSTRNFTDYISLVQRRTGRKLSFQTGRVIISERLAKLLQVKRGDQITLKDATGKARQLKVGGITEMYLGHFVLMNRTTYQRLFQQDFQANANLVDLRQRTSANTKRQAAAFMKLAGVAGVVQNTTLTKQIAVIVQSLDKIMKVLIVIAGLLAIVILYNLTNINVSERIRELSTIKVLGFYDQEVTMYIYRETILLTILGILTGFGLGELLHEYIIKVVPPDDVMFNPVLSANSFWIPTLIVGLVTVGLGYVVNYRLKHIDMLAALKSMD